MSAASHDVPAQAEAERQQLTVMFCDPFQLDGALGAARSRGSELKPSESMVLVRSSPQCPQPLHLLRAPFAVDKPRLQDNAAAHPAAYAAHSPGSGSHQTRRGAIGDLRQNFWEGKHPYPCHPGENLRQRNAHENTVRDAGLNLGTSDANG